MQLATSQSDQHSSAVHARDLNVFREIASRSFVPLEITASQPEHFSARLVSVDADSVHFNEISAKPHLVERTDANIQSGGSGFYKVSLLLSGSSILVQDGKEVVMQAGDLSIYDTSRPYSLIFNEDFRNLIMMLPKDRFQLPVALTEQLTAVALTKEHPELAPIVTSFLSQFPARMQPLNAGLRAKLAHTSLDLVCTMLSNILDADPVGRDPHQVLLQKIFTFIETNLASPDLGPNSIAAAHYISTRHLHALFREAHSTVSTYIRERRLERCRLNLLDPVLSDRTISGIANSWGFSDAAHFSRVFKAAYGVSPSEIRRPQAQHVSLSS